MSAALLLLITPAAPGQPLRGDFGGGLPTGGYGTAGDGKLGAAQSSLRLGFPKWLTESAILSFGQGAGTGSADGYPQRD